MEGSGGGVLEGGKGWSFRAVADGIEECEDVFGGCFGLDIVDGIEDETAVFVEDFDSSADFIVDVGG